MELKGFLLARLAEDEEAAHVAHHDPARAFAECAAKRAIIEMHKVIVVWPEGTGGSKYYTGGVDVCASCDERTHVPCPTLRALAAVYADHPDYQQEWAA